MSDFSGIIADASNVTVGSNPSYTFSNFIAIYPQFGPDSNGNSIIPQVLVEKYIALADASIKQQRWQDIWELAMGWFVAHFCTLYIQSMASVGSDAATVMQAAQAKGLDTSVSAGGVSVSTDYNLIASGIDGWANWKLTAFGMQIVTHGRLIGMGGMYVY